ncbi:transglutaminase TgpA family protein [Stieleria varia]|uniref:Protein-glutamine gamma-glutamyltransferase n=1 Tax=Stieleria varia TaxID=2528005 RepID=A0A5C6ASH1_9BACT|nr:transglutaminaseTgpA domain-containing protein [Stieleria varia]TWU01134.1 Protein-glutamine gamma-glutamyltransferase [Stieleria varia]
MNSATRNPVTRSSQRHSDFESLVTSPATVESDSRNIDTADIKLKMQFALLSMAGGMVLSSGQGTESIAVIAILSAIVGFVFVDWLRIASLPPIGAYVAMGGAAAYCVKDFWSDPDRSEQQMISVALLLVLVQAVLMLQVKSRRIYEQLGVFCLLELVVAAIFNDAINYGLWLLPTALVGGCALSLLGITSTLDDVAVSPKAASSGLSDPRERPRSLVMSWLLLPLVASKDGPATIQSWSPTAAGSLLQSSTRWPWYALMTLTPAVLVISTVFFYVLPRKMDANRAPGTGKTLIGFDDQIRLEQLGHMMQNADTALRIVLTDRDTGTSYRLKNGMYLRGRTLEKYSVDLSQAISTWNSLPTGPISGAQDLPPEYFPIRRGERGAYDSVQVEITCEPMNSASLFAIAPYHNDGGQRIVTHAVDRWTLTRRDIVRPFPRIKYRFGTNAFFRGEQSDWIVSASPAERIMASDVFSISQSFRDRFRGDREPTYADQLLSINRQQMPTVVELAQTLMQQLPAAQRNSYSVAKAFQLHLATDPRYTYTVNLNAAKAEGVDPIEQFVAKDRRGHCQYFASALAMMLRSVGIPSRVIVGYRTDEYSDLGQYYIARQQHAHAWVEALIDREQMPGGITVAGQPDRGQYWLRLDPTPGQGGMQGSGTGQVDTVIDLAKNIWEEYVVDMNAERQNQAIGNREADDADGTRLAWVSSLRQKLAAFNTGDFDGETVSLKKLFSPPVAALVITVSALALLLAHFPVFRIRMFRLLRRSASGEQADTPSTAPQLSFYRDALEVLSQIGIVRGKHETPSELLRRVAQQGQSESLSQPLSILTGAFVQQRYGGRSERPDARGGSEEIQQIEGALDRLRAAVQQRRHADLTCGV